MEDQRRNTYTIVALAALAAIVLGCVAGALAGGMVGVLTARRAADRAMDRVLDELSQLRSQTIEPWQGEVPVPVPLPEEVEPLLQAGAIIVEVIPGSAADEAGLKAGDVLLAIDRISINRNHPLPEIIAQYEPGDRVTVRFTRAGQEDSVRLVLGEHPDNPDQAYLGVYFREMPGLQFERPGD